MTAPTSVSLFNWDSITSIAVKQPVDGLILSNSVRAAVTGSSIAVDGGWIRSLL